MTLDDIQVEGSQRFYTSEEEIDLVEREFNTRFPSGYREFIARFGEGELAGYVRVYPPHQILSGDNSVVEWRKRIDEYWVWEAGHSVLTKRQALECLNVADTLDGDELVFHPTNPDRLYILPHEHQQIYIAGDGFLMALDWLLSSGVLTDRIDERTFVPFDGRAVPVPDVEIDDSVGAPPDVVSVETTQHEDGRIVCHVYRVAAHHYTEPWIEGSPLPVKESVIMEKAAEAAAVELGEAARVDELELETSFGPAHYRAECLPIANKGFAIPKMIYLDLKGRVITPSEHVFTDPSAYEDFNRELFGG